MPVCVASAPNPTQPGCGRFHDCRRRSSHTPESPLAEERVLNNAPGATLLFALDAGLCQELMLGDQMGAIVFPTPEARETKPRSPNATQREVASSRT